VTGTAGQITASPTTGDVILSLPSTLTEALTLTSAAPQITLGATSTPGSMVIFNGDGGATHKTTITTTAGSSRTLAIPNLTGSDTIAVLNQAQTFAGAETFNLGLTANAVVKATGVEGDQLEIAGAGLTDFKINVGASGLYFNDVTNSKTPFVVAPNTSNSLTVGTSTVAIVGNTTVAGSLGLGTNTITGNFTASGVPLMTGLSAGTQVSCLGLDSGNHVVLNAAACGSGGGSGTVNAGTTPQAAYYATSSTAVSGASGVTFPNANSVSVGTPSGSAPSTGIVDVATGFQVNGVAVGQVVAGTSQTVSAAQWAVGTTFVVSTGSQTLTLPATTTLAANGGIIIQTVGQSVSLAPNGSDTINGANSTLTIGAGVTSTITTNASGAVYATPTITPVGANPSGTASDTASNGSAATFMRSDGTPAVQKGSDSAFGIVKVDGTTITASGGVITATAGGSGCTVSGAAGAVFNTGSSTCTTDTSILATAGALSLGASGTAGSVAMGNATTGTITLQPVTGALGSVTASLPANTGTIAELNLAQTWTAAQTNSAAAPQLILGVNTSTLGAIKMFGNTSGDVTIEPNAVAGTSTIMKVPAWGATGNVAAIDVAQTFSAAQTFGETHGTTYAPTLTSNNYNAATTDCGKVLLIPTGTTPTVTMPNVNAACTIVLVQASATQFTVQAASGGTIHSVNSYTKSKAQYAVLFLTIIVPSASVAEWTLGGDGA
jgi:hypothetical protein